MFVLDPFDLDADCCLDVAEPVRPHHVVEANLTITNHEESRVTGEVHWKLVDVDTDEEIADLEEEMQTFNLEAGEVGGFELEFVPEDFDVPPARVAEFDDQYIGRLTFALENVRAPDEEGAEAHEAANR